MKNVWFKSSFSSGGDNCVEVMFTDEGVQVRNSKHPDAGVTRYTNDEWSAFLSGVKHGEFQLP